jgi:hypothetical protein
LGVEDRVIYADLSAREVPPADVPTTQPSTQPATESTKPVSGKTTL